MPQTSTQTHSGSGYELLYSFKGGTDGQYPGGGLVRIGDLLYGTTFGQCGYSCAPGTAGTVFDLTTAGVENVIYSFKGAPDASNPTEALTDLHGVLYGTTQGGGAYGFGTVFAVTTSGTEHVVYSFKGGSDGRGPFASLIAVKGVLYGTTFSGGGSGCNIGCGTVFRVSTSGKERVLYSFKGYPHDGANPLGSLVAVHSKLYGTTWSGGGGGSEYGNGTVFEVSDSGHERVLHSFKGPPDGENPGGGLVAINGTMYGTTANGGTSTACQTFGCGTEFDVNASGKERVLYSFKGGRDGGQPYGELLLLNRLLYGTGEGGAKCAPSGRCGIVFSLSTSGIEHVLYRFKGYPDGAYPDYPLIAVDGRLYGITAEGGADDFGTAFALTP